MKRTLWIAAAAALLALVVWALRPSPEPPAEPRAATAPAAPKAAAPPAPAEAAQAPAPAPAASEAPPAPSSEAPVAQLRREPKLAAEPLSDVAHELVGAWDDRGSAPELGAHRVLVAVVSPSASDAEIERLLRDARARHRDAEVLDVRVYDSAEAATRAGWVGAHQLVGEVKRNDRLRYDQMTVRGRAVTP
jgi:hypothetical protein